MEDSDTDAALIIRQLQRGGLEPVFERVETEVAFRAALDEKTWDVVISDHSLPRFSGLAALTTLQSTGRDIPFILVSGTIGETLAVAAMKAGAHDYVLKDQLTRLPAAVEREVREAGIRAEERRMREQLIISERMASAGTLAAGVAHEINNPLAVAMANLEFITTTLASLKAELRARAAEAPGEHVLGWLDGKLGEVSEPLAEAHEAVDRIRTIVRDVKLFSRSQDEHSGPIDVQRVIESSLRLAWNEIRHRATLVKEYTCAPKVEANESRLGQVVLNLIVNAAQSIPEGCAEKNTIRVVSKTTDAGWALIEVGDTGSGIPPADLDRIFDPFFTTKPVGVGTGLGLAICHRIVTDLNGRIEVESDCGKGTTFRVLLPPVKSEAEEVKDPVIAAPLATRRGRLLVIDDEVGIGRAIKRSLSPHHDITALTSAEEALALIASGARFDVILSDVMMPEVTGLEFHERLTALVPEQAARIIFLTGGAFTPKAREFLDRMTNLRIEKPFDMAELQAVVNGVIDQG